MSILRGGFGGGGVGFASSSHITGGVTGSPGSKVIGGVGAVSQYALIAASRIVSQSMLPAAPTTLNPLDLDPNIVLLDGNLVAKIATFDGNYHGVRGSRPGVTNSFFEVTVLDYTAGHYSTLEIGLANSSATLTPTGSNTRIAATDPVNALSLSEGGTAQGPGADSSGTGTGHSYSAGALYGVHLKASSVDVYVNGVLEHTFATLPSGDLLPLISIRHDGFQIRANFGDIPYSFAPAGALTWDGATPPTTVTLSPFYKSPDVTLSNGNLTVTEGTGFRNSSIHSEVARGAGYYYEASITVDSSFFSGDTFVGVGTAVNDTTQSGNFGLTASEHVAYDERGAMQGLDTTSGYATWGFGNGIIGVLTTATSVKFFKDGTLIRESTGGMPGNAWFPLVRVGDEVKAVTFNFGATTLAHLPAGATSWDGTQFHVDINLAAGSGTFNITGNAASMAVGDPAASGTFAITGNSAGMAVNLPALSGTFNITGRAAGMAVGLPASSGSFAITGYSTVLDVKLPASSGSFAYTGYAATLIHVAKLAAGSGSFAYTGNAAGMGVGLPAGSGAFNYTGYAAGEAVGLPAGSGTFLITGRAASMGVGLPAGSGTFAIVGGAAAESVNEPAGSGTFLFTGYSAKFAVQMPASSGTFLITGYDATLTATHAGINLAADSGTFSINGRAASLDVRASVDSGTFSISGGVVSFAANEPLASGAFAITGNAATFSRTSVAHVLAAGSGSFIIAGGDTTWRRFRRKYGTWVQPPVAPPVQVSYETLIRRNDATFRKDGQRLPEYEFSQHTFVADPATRGPYEAP
jgi:hypothetical protein